MIGDDLNVVIMKQIDGFVDLLLSMDLRVRTGLCLKTQRGQG